MKGAGASWHDVFTGLGEVQRSETKRLTKLFSSGFLFYLLLNSLRSGSLVSITWSDVTASVPASYLSLTASLLLFLTVLCLQSVFIIILSRAMESIRHKLPRFSAGMYGLFNGEDGSSLSTPLLQTGFLRELIPVSALLTMMNMLVFLFLLVPIAAFAAFLLGVQIDLIVNYNIGIFEKVAAASGIIIVCYSVVYIFLFNIPMPMRKNSFRIRWGVLARLYPIGMHPRVSEWLDEDRN